MPASCAGSIETSTDEPISAEPDWSALISTPWLATGVKLMSRSRFLKKP